MLGTVVNTLTVIAGSSVGLLLGERIGDSSKETVFQVVGLFTLYLAIDMALKAKNPVALILSLLLGTLLGEWMRLEDAMERGADALKVRLGGDSNFVEGLMTAFLTFCVGPMTIVGSLRDGMGDPSIILAKSVMDSFTSMAYAAALGSGVLLSSIPLFLFQGFLSILGSFIGASLPGAALGDLTAAGGIILLGLALNLLRLKRIRVGNMLPSLLLAPLLSIALSWLSSFA